MNTCICKVFENTLYLSLFAVFDLNGATKFCALVLWEMTL